MAWLRVEDTAHSHPQVLALGLGGDDRQINEAFGWAARCASWSAEHLQDRFVPEAVARQFAGARYPQLLRAGRKAGLIEPRGTRGPAGEPGWQLQDGDDAVLHLRTREEVELDRARRGTTRRQDATRAVRLRDGDQCRYCRRTVDFRQRKAARSGTYDHPDPADRATFVVACSECNSLKGQRTPEQWHAAGGHLLSDPPTHPHYADHTAAWLAQAGLLPPRPDAPQAPAPAPTLAAPAADATARPGTQPDTAAVGTTQTPPPAEPAQVPPGQADRSGSGPDPSKFGLPGQAPPGRDGPGARNPTTRTRDGPRTRRGTRGRRARPPTSTTQDGAA